jgi:hypothetical protein
VNSGPRYPLGTVDTVLRAYYMFKAYEGVKGKKNTKEMKKIGNVIQNKIQDFKLKKFHYKPTCEVRSV